MTIEPGGQLPLAVQLDVEARFETFYAGVNANVVAALKSPPAPGLWVSGGRASGRSHLLQAVVADRPAGSAMYVPLAQGFPCSILEGLPADMVVCLDDVDHVLGDEDWERALLLLYERLLSGDGRLIVAATNSAAALDMALADWRSRCQSLLAFRLAPLDDEAQQAALRKRAAYRGLELPDETARYLLSRLPREPRVLYEWLGRLDEASLAAKRRLTVPFVREILRRDDVATD